MENQLISDRALTRRDGLCFSHLNGIIIINNLCQMNKEPKISVITACYNHGKFINEMIESVIQQTFEDYEIIIVNDGSTDDTAEILKNITHEKVKIIHTENHGPADARNTAIKHARAPLIMNLDADDKIAPGLLEKAYKIFSTEFKYWYCLL